MIDTVAAKTAIIDLAVSGKISEQFQPSDSVSEIIAALPEVSNKRKKLLEQAFEYEKQNAIPSHWKWIRLGEITSYGDTPTKAYFDEIDGDTWILDLEDINSGGELVTKTRVHEKMFSGDKTIFKKGQVLYSKLRPYLKKVLVADEDGISTPELISFDTYGGVIPQYIVYCLLSSFTNRAIDKRSYGIKMPRVDAGFMVNLPVPLPPVSEQKYIIDSVQSSFSQIDIINTLQTQYADNLTVLKDKLIDAAIQGKLTEQLPEDGTAEELYQQIQAEKLAFIKAGKIKKEKPLPEIAENDLPFVIPVTWKWIRWGELSNQIQYGYNAPAKETGQIRMVRITDIQGNQVNWSSVPFCDIDEEDIERYRLHPNDILFARTGGTVGKSYLVETVEEDAVFAGYLIRTSYSHGLNSKYMKYFMESRLYWRQLQDGTTATAQPNCNAKTLSKMMLPLPPKAEQDRIVVRLDALIRTIES